MSAGRGGIGDTLSTVQTVFVVLKLCDVVTWSWWGVLAPLWLAVAWFVVRSLFAGVAKDWGVK